MRWSFRNFEREVASGKKQLTSGQKSADFRFRSNHLLRFTSILEAHIRFRYNHLRRFISISEANSRLIWAILAIPKAGNSWNQLTSTRFRCPPSFGSHIMAHFWGFGQVFYIFCISAKKATFEPISAPFEARNSRLASGSGSYHLKFFTSHPSFPISSPNLHINREKIGNAGRRPAFPIFSRFIWKYPLTIAILSCIIYPLFA